MDTAADQSLATPEPVLSARAITKSFPGILANDRIDLDIYAGEVHAVLGENGAGKSTLMKILYGFYRADAGEILLNGHAVTIRSPHDARTQRIGMVFQQYTLIPAMTVAENIALCLSHLPAVLADARLLILDEPTRALAPHEIDALFGVLAGLRRDHYAVVFITHKLSEVLACADRITVLRRGRVAGTLMRSEATESRLVSLMFRAMPQEVSASRAGAPDASAQPLLELRGVHTRSNGGAVGLTDITLTILPGEVVGVAGVSGNGQRELGDVIMGLEPAARGTKLLWGQDATSWSVATVRTSGVAFIPEDAVKMALVPQLSALASIP
ncbi:MAG: ATP-binding cassette domain-containing protein [Armatimonadota bacterium]